MPTPTRQELESARKVLATLLGPPEPVTRAEFDKMTPRDASDFCRKGGKITNSATTEASSPRLAILNQNQFSKLSEKDRRDYTKFGGLVRDNNTPPPAPRPSAATPKPEGIAFND